MEHIYPERSRKSKDDDESELHHNEESYSRRKPDKYDRVWIMNAQDKHSHPLHDQNKCLYNIVMGQIASDDINVAEALSMESR